MGWSTRELADLAGATVKTVRHYHRMGLLDLPERGPNGYKRYEAAHLARVLRIKRLTGFGLTLSRIRELEDAGRLPDDAGDGAVDAIDAELAESIERLRRARADLAVLREHRAPLDTPAPFAPVVDGLSEEDRDLLAVVSAAFGADALDDLRALMAEAGDGGPGAELYHLPEDAGDAAVEELAARLAASIRRDRERFPWLADPGSRAARGPAPAESALGNAFAERFNPAQLRALARAHALADQAG
ncbi:MULTISPECIES: MerR family transcriptional regulator [Actinosynnema]|uniref:helix-turn-helix domain-containing protein n=1 Tax=Actinosynnema TaxID=40566 RepID=UPI0020A59162|nr:MerR family transcriptional regulator [Actinosynnema pretiosum]MCP2094855.1 DNA-binding transcriptional regulator, MerR family [Actinosynnema pretiosum]